MRSFIEYLQEKRNTLSWDSGNAENRPYILSWDSGHAELRDSAITEEITKTTHEDGWLKQIKTPGNAHNGRTARYDADIHDHPDIAPKKLVYPNAVKHYTMTASNEKDGNGSSKNINGYLRNRMGDKEQHIEHHEDKKVLHAVKRLSANFTPENANRKELTTYSGVPAHIGEKLETSKAGTIHYLAGFTSTSTDVDTAAGFSHESANNEETLNGASSKVRHIVKFHVKPGAGLSVVHNSPYSENEILLHHGAKTEYSHTEVIHGSHYDGHPKNYETHIHHVTVHPEHMPLESYGPYDHPTK